MLIPCPSCRAVLVADRRWGSYPETGCLWRKCFAAGTLIYPLGWGTIFSENQSPLCANAALRIGDRALNATHRLQPRARMDFGLRQHRGLRAEALHQRADEGTDCS